MNKRQFLKVAATAPLVLTSDFSSSPAFSAALSTSGAEDEAFWSKIRAQFRLTSEYINLENGFYCFQPEPVFDRFVENARALNLEAAHYLRTRSNDDELGIRRKLAAFAGCSATELIVTRNTTESLDTVINGFDWRAGDEAVMAAQDYGSMLDMFTLVSRRHGMVNRVVDVPLDPKSDGEVVEVYARAITSRTRLLMVSHMINITGQILPVRAICEMAHARAVPVMVDGAHTFAQLDFRLPDLQCDYFGASLHKWLCAPLGTGILYVREDRIGKLWPVYGDASFPDTDIGKLNHMGTHPVHSVLTIERALAFQEMIGNARKERRLRYLQEYWTRQVRGHPTIVVNTPSQSERACAIANVGVRGVAPGDLARMLLEDHKIFTVAIDSAGVRGVRVAPQIYTSLDELNALVAALKQIAS